MLNLMTESIISVKASRPHCQEGCLYEGVRIWLKSEDADISYLACIMLNFRITTFCASSSLKKPTKQTKQCWESHKDRT